MQLPWWGWSLISVAGALGTAWVSVRLKKADLPSEVVNLYLFATGTVVFFLYAIARGTNLDLPSEQRWLLLPLAAALFVYNFALVSAYGLAANAGFVRAFATIEMVLLTLVLAGEAWYRELPVDLPWWKVVGVALCFGGAVLVALPSQR